jgi:TetR/AcrR family transcriptional regulator, cholesterol catabolism regulator
LIAVEKRGPGRPPSPELTDQRRQEIITTALRLFAERGYRATTMGDIAQTMGCTKGLLYHYFDSKAELAHQARVDAHDLMRGRLEEIVASDLCPSEKLREAINHFISEILFGYQRYVILAVGRSEMQEEVDEARRREARARQRRFVMLYRDIIQAGIDAGEFEEADASVMANAVIQGIFGVARWHKPEGRLPPERVRDEMCALLMRMVTKRAE